MSKIYKYGLLILAVAFLGYHSVYIEKLSEVRAQEAVAFDFETYADSIYYQGMLKNESATALSALLPAIQNNTEEAFNKYGNRLGIGNSAYFMVKCNGEITAITSDEIRLNTKETGEVRLNTQYIFGNALRDASRLVKLTDFKTNAAFNQVSEALNALIRTKVIPPLKEQLQLGDSIVVIGAIKLSKKNITQPSLIITPAQIIPQ